MTPVQLESLLCCSNLVSMVSEVLSVTSPCSFFLDAQCVRMRRYEMAVGGKQLQSWKSLGSSISQYLLGTVYSSWWVLLEVESHKQRLIHPKIKESITFYLNGRFLEFFSVHCGICLLRTVFASSPCHVNYTCVLWIVEMQHLCKLICIYVVGVFRVSVWWRCRLDLCGRAETADPRWRWLFCAL